MNTNSYKSAGVDKEEGYKAVARMKTLVAATHSKRVLSGLGSFGALYELGNYRNPVLVSGTDGVGTKIKLALQYGRYDAVGIDCVAMCVNDVLCHGAKPLFFLDYMACGRLDAEVAAALVAGMAEGCRLSEMALVGGETAEMPGMYAAGDYDVAGFCVGVVEKDKLITGEKVRAGDKVWAIPSSGFHANGFSLIRKIIEEKGCMQEMTEALLMPTRIYAPVLKMLLVQMRPHGVAHITGGGLPENLPRMIPEGLGVQVRKTTLRVPEAMQKLQELGNIPSDEMLGTFNMGVGMALIVADKDSDRLQHCVPEAYLLGNIEPSAHKIELL